MKHDKNFLEWMRKNNYDTDKERTGGEWDEIQKLHTASKKKGLPSITLDMLYASSVGLRQIGIPPKRPFVTWLISQNKLKARPESEWIALVKEYNGEEK
jgi:hypothetical protein